MTEQQCKERFEYAISHRVKVWLQMTDTPDDKYILFHPYALLVDAFEGLSVIGLVERHHTAPEVNYVKRPRLSGIKNVQIQNESFEPDHQLWSTINLQTIDIIIQA